VQPGDAFAGSERDSGARGAAAVTARLQVRQTGILGRSGRRRVPEASPAAMLGPAPTEALSLPNLCPFKRQLQPVAAGNAIRGRAGARVSNASSPRSQTAHVVFLLAVRPEHDARAAAVVETLSARGWFPHFVKSARIHRGARADHPLTKCECVNSTQNRPLGSEAETSRTR
jgi:hypothetical protein